MVEQGRKLVKIIGVVVKALDNFEEKKGAVQELGKRHVQYGVYLDEHYDNVAAALLYAFDKQIGDKFTEETKAAWVEIYTLLKKIMMEASKPMIKNDKKTEGKTCCNIL